MYKILVLLSTYNGEKYLEEQIESVLSQKGVDVTLLIRDDGSCDGSKELLSRYESKSNVIIEKGLNKGCAESFKKLLLLAYEHEKFDYYAFCDQDDVWLPEKLGKACSKLSSLPTEKPCLYCSNLWVVDENLNVMGLKWKKGESFITKEESLVYSMATGCTMVFNRKLLEVFYTHQPRKMILHDSWVMLTCMFLGVIYYDDDSYIWYRQHGNNVIGAKLTLSARMKSKIKSIGHINKQHLREIEAQELLRTYDDLLSDEDKRVIKIVANYRKTLITRLRFMLGIGPTYRSIRRRKDNLFLRLRILMGGGISVRDNKSWNQRKGSYCAIVVLYYPTEDVIKKFEEIGSQMPIILIDNTPQEECKYKPSKLVYIPQYKNLGIAKAQNIGINYAYKKGYDFVVFFDQDSEFDKTYCENIIEEYQLIKCHEKNLAILGPTVVNKETGNIYKNDSKESKKNYSLVSRLISSGTTLQLKTILDVGPLESELFIDDVDFEWCWRAIAMNYVCARTSDIFLNHKVGGKDKTLIGYPIVISAPIRYYYQYRNYLRLTRRTYVPTIWKIKAGIRKLVEMIAVPLYANGERKQILKYMFKGIAEG